jgi:hypothetical protein
MAEGKSVEAEVAREFALYLEEMLPKWKADFEGGDSKGLLATIQICLRCGIETPPWAIHAFTECTEGVFEADVASWDDAFGRPYPKGKHLDKVRQKLRLCSRVFRRISQIRAWRPGDEPIADWLTERASIGVDLFEIVGKEFGIGPRKCKDLYYEQKRRDARNHAK